jgi:hypothetical protein
MVPPAPNFRSGGKTGAANLRHELLLSAESGHGLGVHGPRHVSDEPRGFEQFAPKFPIRLRAACFGAQSTSLTAFSSAESARVPSNEFIHQQFQRLK